MDQDVQQQQQKQNGARWFEPDTKKSSYKTDDHIISWIQENYTPNTEVAIGTDSQINTKHLVRYVTVVCFYNKGHGGRYFYSIEHEKRKPLPKNLRGQQEFQRMTDEVEKSLRVANLVFEKTGIVPCVHLDISPKELHNFTSTMADYLKSYVISYGFNCCLKPESWAANSVANHHSRI